MEVITVSSKGQIVIPERVRKHLGIKTGSKLVLLEKEGNIVLKQEADVENCLKEAERKEAIGWMILGEESLKKTWDNPYDEVWNEYL